MHIDMPTAADIRALAASRTPLSVTIYMPTSTNPDDSEHDRLVARGLVERAAQDLRTLGDKRSVEPVIEQLESLVEDTGFWRTMGRSLAVFATPTSMVEFRLPNSLTTFVGVSDHFSITPLLRAVTFPHAALVLALSQNGARLVEVTSDLPPEEVEVPGLPRDAASSVGLRSIGGRSPYGRIQGDEGRKVRLTQYARAVDHALRPLLNGESLPLILAAAEPIASIFRNLCGYANLVPDTVEGNPEELTDKALAEAARPLLDAYHARQLASLEDLYAERRNSGRATGDLAELARAAAFGAIATLAVDMDAEVPGTIDEDGSLRPGGTDGDVLEEIARAALATGARVLAVRSADLPEGLQAAGILRHTV